MPGVQVQEWCVWEFDMFGIRWDFESYHVGTCKANTLELRDIRSLVQAGNETAGDIDQRKLEDLLDQRIKKYFSRWDNERQRPIRQNGQEKSVGNKWKQDVGEILAAWYTWQALIVEQKTILRIEQDIDSITSQLITIEEQVKKDQDFLSTFGALRDQLSERSVMEERISRLTSERELFKKVFGPTILIPKKCSQKTKY
mgnify:CR=1 FL=1